MILISSEDVHRICSFPELVNTFEQFHCEEPALLKDMLMSCSQLGHNQDDHLLIRAAWLQGNALGLKSATVFANNMVNYGLPAIHAIYTLFDGKNGKPTAVIDGTSMTYYKTAADSALGAKMLIGTNVTNMAMIGAGAMAPYLIQAHVEIHQTIEKVTVWNRSLSKAEKLADSISLPNVEIQVVENIESAVQNSQLVSCATMTVEPIICGDWLQPGTHVDLVGAFRPDMREADDKTIRKSKVFVDSRKTTIGEIGEITIPIETGVMQESDVLADLYELCSGKVKGRLSNDDITLFKNGGGGHLDLMTAKFISARIKSMPKNNKSD